MGRQEPLLPFNKTRPSRTRGPSRPVKGGLLQQLHNHQHHEPPATPKLTPRKAILAIFLALLGLSLLHRPVSNRYGGVPRYGNGLRTPEERARHILTTTPLIDGHVDFPMLIRYFYGNRIYEENFTQPFVEGGLPGHVDLHRLRQGQSGGAFWSLFAPCPKNGSDFSDENYASSVQFTLDQIDVMTRLQAAYPDHFSQKVDSSNAYEAFKQGKLISPLGIEGLHQIGNSAANLRKFHELGVRYATLTHNCHNKFADAAILENPTRKAEPLWGGVSPLGRRLIHEMNRIGMIVDISHVSEDTMLDVLGNGDDWAGSEAPVIFSHSSAWSICPHPRNVKDNVLELVKKRNSLVMVNIAPDFISCVESDNPNGLPDFFPQNSTIEHAAQHIFYIGNLIGFDHVGIGTDFDGIPSVPRGLEDVTKYPDLIAELLKLGVSNVDAAKVVGGNLLRVWKEVDEVAARLQSKGELPLEDVLSELKFSDVLEATFETV
ncbi:membrane dipeptidase-domain-containing protein [Fusarium solani]|uniref:Dipeptidase n=1 Tax=Fusarium solani TaxID=169388 RepID=A0A9P9KJG0_FUSSL|nr:membrane dipeptidase-domain-containing protein [Fusarium solani]KAH7263908.1 membrane dipeptidase-domain-containing protein [Fusarium solani]